MRKLSLLVLVLVVLSGTGCRLFKEKHVYQEARELPPLQVPEDLDTPNTSSALAVPPARGEKRLITELTPPGMAFQVRQSENGRVLIESRNRLPVLVYFGPQEAVISVVENLDLPESWRLVQQEGCTVHLAFVDPNAKKVEDLGFFKRIFTREARFTDHSGHYRLRCDTDPGKVEITMTNADGSAPPALLVDDVLGAIYQALADREQAQAANK